MFMQIAIGAIGVGIVVMIGYLIIAQVSSALPAPTTARMTNPCYGNALNETAACNTTTADVCTYCNSSAGCIVDQGITDNTTAVFSGCTDASFVAGKSSLIVTVGAGLGLVAVGIIVLAAFGLIQVFQ
tara:strand:+ start:141 stop:524 length:384 start_codon:yes stop_codon:yes gene_type:complete